MRSLISLPSAALVVALALLPGGVATASGQSKAKARSKRQTTQSTSKSPASSSTVQATAATAPPAQASIIQTTESADGVRRITPLEARSAVEKGRAVIIDVRGEDSYNAGHVKGARWINLNEIEARLSELPRDKMIITYCS